MNHPSRPRRTPAAFTAVLGVALGALGIAGCTGSAKHASSSAPRGSSAPTAVSSPAPSRTAVAVPLHNPLTGIGPEPRNPVIAVKIDDTAPGRPQLSIDKADVVYIEAVEAGLTRLAAIFGTNLPTVGYVRSTRPSDPDLLLQYGKLTEAYSGGQHVSLGLRVRSGITGWSNDAGAAGFFRVSRVSDYINVELNLRTVAARTKTLRPKSNGWTFAPTLAGLTTTPGLRVRTEVTGSYRAGAGTAVEFRWDPALKSYVRYIGGVRQFAADGRPITATNVIVQSCRIVSFPADRDINGRPAQFTYTVGTGPVSVFRNGRRIDGVWSRPTLQSGTSLRTAAGKALPLNPGNTWVVLIHTGIAVRGS